MVQAAVTTITAARFGLKVGARLNAGPVQLVITGIIRPTNPAATFWTDEPGAARPVLTQPRRLSCRTGSQRPSSAPVRSR